MTTTRADRFSVEELRRIASTPGEAGKFVIALLATLEDDDEEVRAWASDALQSIDSPPREHALMIAESCGNKQSAVAAWACKLIAKLHDVGEHQAAIARALNQHPSISTRQEAAAALGRIGNLNAASLESLRKASTSTDPRLKRLAEEALAAAAAT